MEMLCDYRWRARYWWKIISFICVYTYCVYIESFLSWSCSFYIGIFRIIFLHVLLEAICQKLCETLLTFLIWRRVVNSDRKLHVVIPCCSLWTWRKCCHSCSMKDLTLLVKLMWSWLAHVSLVHDDVIIGNCGYMAIFSWLATIRFTFKDEDFLFFTLLLYHL